MTFPPAGAAETLRRLFPPAGVAGTNANKEKKNENIQTDNA